VADTNATKEDIEKLDSNLKDPNILIKGLVHSGMWASAKGIYE